VRTATGGSSVTATAEVTAVATGRGVRLTTLRSAPPLVLRRSASDAVRLVSVGGGPVAGDRLRLRLRVEPGARLTVHQTAATVLLPAPVPSGPSTLDVDVEVEDGGSLCWIGEPTVATRGCEHLGTVRVRLHGDARLQWREELVAGRFGEPSGIVRSDLDVRRGGRPLLRSSTSVGDGRWSSPAAGGSARVLGARLEVGTAEVDARPGHAPTASVPEMAAWGSEVRAAVHRPAPDVALVTVLGEEHPPVRAALEAAGRHGFGLARAAQ
jgi:urease accessory protein